MWKCLCQASEFFLVKSHHLKESLIWGEGRRCVWGGWRLGHIILAFVICFRKYFPCQQRSSPGKWSVFEGRRSGMVGKKGGAVATWVNNAGSRRVQARELLHALTFLLRFCPLCCSAMSAIHHKNDFYHLNLLITYPSMCCEGMRHLQSKIAKQCSRWDALLNTMHGTSHTPPSQLLQRAGRWFAPVQPQHYITAKGALHFTSYCAPGVKVTWWMTGQSDRLSDAARPRRPGGRIVSRTGAGRGHRKKVAWGLTTDGGWYNTVLWVFGRSLDRINQSS